MRHYGYTTLDDVDREQFKVRFPCSFCINFGLLNKLCLKYIQNEQISRPDRLRAHIDRRSDA